MISNGPRSSQRFFALCALILLAGFLLASSAAGQTPVEFGYRDFSFGTGNSTPTGEKAENKLWWNDGFWWGSLWNDSTQKYHIYRLDSGSQSWVDTGTPLDDRRNAKADTLWDSGSGKLYVASHVFSTNAVPSTSTSQWARLFRFSYDAGSRSYSADPGFPVLVTRGNSETLTLARDSLGRLWVTYVQSSKVMVNRSVSSDAEWGEPFILPAGDQAVSVSSDDISAIVAFGGNSIGVMWSNQLTAQTYFAVHRDGDADTAWQPLEVVLPDANCAGACADDLINLKADSTGRIFAALKTSRTEPDAPLGMLAVRAPQGAWTTHIFGLVRDHHTRTIVLLHEENRELYIFATNPENGGAIYFKKTSMDDPQFATGQGDPFIRSSSDITINNATSTRQNLSSETGLLVLASDQNTKFYLHNFLTLTAQASPPAISSFSPTKGPVGTAVVISGSNFTGATQVAFNGQGAAFTVVSDTRIDTTVPAGATTGKISVATPAGTGSSAGDFRVIGKPAIQSFSPARGPVGTTVAITGMSFTDATVVAFAGSSASFTIISDTRIDATVPDGAATGKIAVTNPAGTAVSATDFRVTTPPIISSFSPASGPPGTLVTIKGRFFTGTTQVAFGSTTANLFVVVNDSQIVVAVPVGAPTGLISVTSPEGTGFSSQNFEVINPLQAWESRPHLAVLVRIASATSRPSASPPRGEHKS